MKSKELVLILVSVLAAGLVLALFLSADYSTFGQGFLDEGTRATCVGVLSIEGEIVSEQSALFSSGEASSPDIVAALEEARNNDDIGAVLLEINSGGGSAVASKEIYDALAGLGKPSVAYLRDVAASGGYYIASGSTHIVANPNSITGSIGARATFLTYEELFNKLGLREESIKTGELKDLGAGYRNLTEKERKIVAEILTETLNNFVADVEKGRGARLNRNLFNEALDARVMGAGQALRAGLVDEIGGRSAALRRAGELANLTKAGNVKLAEECPLVEEGGLLSALAGLSTHFSKSLARELKGGGLPAGIEYK